METGAIAKEQGHQSYWECKNHPEFYLEISSFRDHKAFLYTNHTLQYLCKVKGMTMSIVEDETRPTEDKGNILKNGY